MSSSPGPPMGSLSPMPLDVPEGVSRCGPCPPSPSPSLGSIPSLYTEPPQDCPAPDYPQEALVFYSPGVGYRGPPLSPSLFCPPVTTLSLPPPPSAPHPASYPPWPANTHTPSHPPWPQPKQHRGLAPGLLLSEARMLGGGSGEAAGGVCSPPRLKGALVRSEVQLCAVCSDYASGYHYGVWACEGCKAFFKRSIQGHPEYICPATNQCTMDRSRRKSCQACRLRRCYEVGMMKCGMRRDRCGYRGVRVRRQVCEEHVPHRLETAFPFHGHTHPMFTPPLSTPLDTGHTLSPQQLISCFLEAEPPDIHLSERPQKPYTEASMMMSLTRLADKELLLMISWAKKIPGFMELGLQDQVHLLECCWLEVLMLGLMWRSVDHPGKLIFCPDLKLNREEGYCVEGIVEIFDMLLAATSRFRELNLQKEEYVCLKAMILLNANMCVRSAESAGEGHGRGRVLRLLDSVTDALVWAINRTGSLSIKEQSARLAQLLMLLSHTRHLSNKGMEHLWRMTKRNVVLLYDLLREMLDANTTHTHSLTHSHTHTRACPSLTSATPSPTHTSFITDTSSITHTPSVTHTHANTHTPFITYSPTSSNQLQQENQSQSYGVMGSSASGSSGGGGGMQHH